MSRYSRQEDDTADIKMAKIRERIRRNFPNQHAALQWRKVSASRIVSHDKRFAVDKHGEGDAVRYSAILLPLTVLAARLFTSDAAKEVCNRHASPLPLEQGAPPTELDLELEAETAARERVPGEDDE